MIETKTIYGSKVHIYSVSGTEHKRPHVWIKCNMGENNEYITHVDSQDLKRPKELKVKEQTSENMKLWNLLERIPFADEYVTTTQVGEETLVEVNKEEPNSKKEEKNDA
jgi:hypothetical protein